MYKDSNAQKKERKKDNNKLNNHTQLPGTVGGATGPANIS